MCTAFSACVNDHYFGRNLDLDYHYNETITITPRGYTFQFIHTQPSTNHHAIIGVATIIDNYPLYYDAINEKGLCMAGLNFPGNAFYGVPDPTKTNVASFELIPWILSQCETTRQAEEMLSQINLCNTAFRNDLPPTPLHWIISDKSKSITVEPLPNGIHITQNPIGVLTNNPTFDYHLQNMANYLNLSPEQPGNPFRKSIDLKPYSLGMGAIGLPGDFSSASRFIRCAFIKENSIWGDDECSRVSQMFHILDSVSQFDGCIATQKGFEKTLYSICCNATRGIFYHTTYSNRQICAVDMHHENLNISDLISYPLQKFQSISYQN